MNLFRTMETRETLLGKSGVYKLTLRGTNLNYIGQTVNLFNRMRKHVAEANSRSEKPKLNISLAIAEHGPDAFDFSVLCFCDIGSLAALEAHYIHVFDSTENGFNIRRKGAKSRYQSVSPSEETRERNREANIGRKRTPETIARMRESALRKPPISEETRARYSAAHKGAKLSEAHKEKLRQHMTGKKLPPEWRAKLAAKALLRGRPLEQLSEDGSVIATYPSLSEAARALGKKGCANLCVAMRSKNKRFAGYVWRYVETAVN